MTDIVAASNVDVTVDGPCDELVPEASALFVGLARRTEEHKRPPDGHRTPDFRGSNRGAGNDRLTVTDSPTSRRQQPGAETTA
jgi:hypothetical protein